MIPVVRTGGTPRAIGHDTGQQLRDLLHQAVAAYRFIDLRPGVPKLLAYRLTAGSLHVCAGNRCEGEYETFALA